VDGGPDAGVKRIAVPWARPFGQFTLLMECNRPADPSCGLL
jgi:hypothetical protein